jgi:hypothetical protein
MLNKVAAVLVVLIVAGTAATWLARDARSRRDHEEQDRALHAQLIERLDRMDHSISVMSEGALAVATRVAQNRDAPAIGPSQIPPAGAPAQAPAATSVETAAARAPLSPEQETHLRTGTEIVDRALAAARWSDEDRDALNVATVTLPGERRAELMARVAAAINRDQLRVETTRAPF